MVIKTIAIGVGVIIFVIILNRIRKRLIMLMPTIRDTIEEKKKDMIKQNNLKR